MGIKINNQLGDLRSQAGFSMVEVIVASGILLILIAILSTDIKGLLGRLGNTNQNTGIDVNHQQPIRGYVQLSLQKFFAAIIDDPERCSESVALGREIFFYHERFGTPGARFQYWFYPGDGYSFNFLLETQDLSDRYSAGKTACETGQTLASNDIANDESFSFCIGKVGQTNPGINQWLHSNVFTELRVELRDFATDSPITCENFRGAIAGGGVVNMITHINGYHQEKSTLLVMAE